MYIYYTATFRITGSSNISVDLSSHVSNITVRSQDISVGKNDSDDPNSVTSRGSRCFVPPVRPISHAKIERHYAFLYSIRFHYSCHVETDGTTIQPNVAFSLLFDNVDDTHVALTG